MFDSIQKRFELNEKFEHAVSSNDLEKVKELFDLPEQERPYVDADLVGGKAIMIAAQHAHWDMVKELYNLEANVDVCVMPHQWYLINECILHAPEKITYPIIDISNINVQNRQGRTPLMISLLNKKGEIAEYLLNTDRLNLVLSDENGENAAHYAAKMENYDFFLKLIEKGIPLLSKNKEGKTPIDLIQNEVFRLSLPIELDKISHKGGNIVFETIEENTTEVAPLTITEEPPKVEIKKQLTGLSSIKRK